MTKNDLEKIHSYLNDFVSSHLDRFPPQSDTAQPTWETLMSLLACIEDAYPDIEFHFFKNYFRVEHFQSGERRTTQDKGSTLKDAIVLVCFKFLSERNKDAPKIELPNDDFLLDDE